MKKNIAKNVTQNVKKKIKSSIKKDELSEGIIGGCVIAAILLAGLVSVFFIFNNVDTGKAIYQGTECFCKSDGLYERVLFSNEEVLRADGRVVNVGELDRDLPVCPQVCARIGSYA
jgi:hypothetical protein